MAGLWNGCARNMADALCKKICPPCPPRLESHLSASADGASVLVSNGVLSLDLRPPHRLPARVSPPTPGNNLFTPPSHHPDLVDTLLAKVASLTGATVQAGGGRLFRLLATTLGDGLLLHGTLSARGVHCAVFKRCRSFRVATFTTERGNGLGILWPK